ncbi:MAG: beta-propeller fold lactonase family protein [Candidatus Eremiobacterota bacterium]
MPARFTARVALLLLLTLAWLCAACGEDGVTTTPTGNTLVQTQNSFTLRSDLQILPGDGSVVVNEVTDGQVILSGNVPEIPVGGALMMNTGLLQFIRRVVSVERRPDGTVVVTTTPGSLLDVFESANISQTEMLGPEALRRLRPVMEGVFVGEPVPNRNIEGGFSIPLKFVSAPLTDRNGQVMGTADGQVSLTFGFDTELRFNASKFLNPPTTIEHLRLVPFARAEGRLNITGRAAGDFEQEYHVASFEPVPGVPGGVPLAGFGPVTITANLDLLAYANGQINVSGATTMDGSVGAEFGVEAIDGNFRLVNPEPTRSFQVTPPQVEGSARFSVSLARVKVGIGVLGLGDAHVKADVARAGVGIDFTNTPQPGYRIAAEGEFVVLAGATVRIGPYGVPPFRIPEFTIFNRTLEVAEFRFHVGDPITILRKPPDPIPPTFIQLLSAPGTTSLRPGEYALVVNLGLFLNPAAVPPALFLPLDIDWTSSDSNVLNVAIDSGIVTLVQARQPGTANLGGTHGSGAPVIPLNFTVNPARLTSLRIEPPGADITNRQTLQARAIGTYADGVQVDVTDFVDWVTSNQGLAIVTPRGVVQPGSANGTSGRGGLLQSGATGEVTLSANFQGQSASAQIGLNTPRILSFIVIQGPYPEKTNLFLPSQMSPGDTAQLEAIGFHADGSYRRITQEVDWSTDFITVASVDSRGELSASNPGNTFVRARVQGLPEQVFRVRVNEPFVSSLELSPSEVTLAEGQSVPLDVFANFTDGGNRQNVTGLAQVRSLFPEVASYDPATRRVTCHRTGLSLLYVTYGGAASLAFVTVLPNAASHVFVANTVGDTVASAAVGADGALTQVTGSPFAALGRPSELVRLGNFLVASISGNGPNANTLQVFGYDNGTGGLTARGSVALSGAATLFQPLPMVKVDDNTLAVVLGFDNLIKLFVVDLATGALTEHDSRAILGTGANDVAVHPGLNGSPTFVLVSNTGSNDVSVYLVDLNNGLLSEVAGSPFPNPQPGFDVIGGIQVVGDQVYVTNLIANTVSNLHMDFTTGVLTPGAVTPGGGTAPARMAGVVTLSKSFLYVANTGSADVSGFEVDPSTGGLTALPGFPVAAGGINPHMFTDLTLGNGNLVLYLSTSNDVSGFGVDTATGALTPLPGSPYTGFNSPNGID